MIEIHCTAQNFPKMQKKIQNKNGTIISFYVRRNKFLCIYIYIYMRNVLDRKKKKTQMHQDSSPNNNEENTKTSTEL